MGNRSVVADPRKCVSCKSCMAACAAKHSVEGDVAQARLRVVQVNRSLTSPVLCRHCADAPCASACPAGALFQDVEQARVGVDMSRCIGCRSCVAACPYGAVSLVSRGREALLGESLLAVGPRAVVVKCDRCADREGGPACVEACGFNALCIVERGELGKIIARFDKKPGEASGSSSALRM